MTRDSSENLSESDTGTCDHCEWQTVADSHAELVQAYQDHLRDEHPTVWLQT
jgi:predicted small metal-binding protein